jgi:hypothetical protein
LAGPLGCLRPCSQFWSVLLLTPIIRANVVSAWLSEAVLPVVGVAVEVHHGKDEDAV